MLNDTGMAASPEIIPIYLNYLKMHGHTARVFLHLYKGKYFLWLPVCFSCTVQRFQIKVYSYMKEFAPREQILLFKS